VASIDLPASFLDYAGVRAAYPMAGRSLREEIERGRSKREAAFAVWNDGRPEALVIRRAVEPYRVARTRTHKYILWESKKQALFDLRGDPAETHNLAEDARHAKLLTHLRDLLAQRMRDTADPARSWLG
jgi:arylsulfatase A-like enzyme